MFLSLAIFHFNTYIPETNNSSTPQPQESIPTFSIPPIGHLMASYLHRVQDSWEIHSLKLTANAPENRPGPKRKRSYSNHPFLGASC